MAKAIGLITANYSTKFPSPLTDSRPAASIPFLGRYRAVDFALSNMVNCGIRTVGMIMPYNYRSLIDHVGSGREWELTRKSGGLFILPGSAFGTSRTGSRFLLRDLISNKIFLERDSADLVVVSTANWVYNMDYNVLFDAHVASGADITVVTQPAKDKNGIPTGKYTKFYDGFECSTYTLGKKHKETVCSRHGVNSEAINVLVLEALKGLSASSLSDEKALLQRLNQAKQPKDDLAQQRKLLRQKQKRSAELDDLIQGAYEANFRGNLTDDRLSSLVAKYEAEQEGLEQEIAVLDAQVKYSEAGKTDGKRFLKSLRKFTSFDTLTPDMVNELIEKIVVHERVGTRSSYEQEIEIYFIFVGKVGEYK